MRVTNPIGFIAALAEFSVQLDSLSSDQAAAWVDQLTNAAPKAARRFSNDDLEDACIALLTLKNRLRRKWQRQRRNNTVSAIAGPALAGVTAYLFKYGTLIAP